MVLLMSLFLSEYTRTNKVRVNPVIHSFLTNYYLNYLITKNFWNCLISIRHKLINHFGSNMLFRICVKVEAWYNSFIYTRRTSSNAYYYKTEETFKLNSVFLLQFLCVVEICPQTQSINNCHKIIQKCIQIQIQKHSKHNLDHDKVFDHQLVNKKWNKKSFPSK